MYVLMASNFSSLREYSVSVSVSVSLSLSTDLLLPISDGVGSAVTDDFAASLSFGFSSGGLENS